jgi:deazaflavin-dependent oxidoreductase (nitroreductase family)
VTIERVRSPGKPKGLKRALFRMPRFLYHWKLGFLLGRRFLLLKHVGRKSGLPRETELEVADRDASGAYTIASGFGAGSDWYRNLRVHPDVSICVGNRWMAMRANVLSPEESGEAMVRYGKHYPRAAQEITRLMGFRADGTEEDYRTLGRDEIPFVVLEPLTQA